MLAAESETPGRRDASSSSNEAATKLSSTSPSLSRLPNAHHTPHTRSLVSSLSSLDMSSQNPYSSTGQNGGPGGGSHAQPVQAQVYLCAGTYSPPHHPSQPTYDLEHIQKTIEADRYLASLLLFPSLLPNLTSRRLPLRPCACQTVPLRTRSGWESRSDAGSAVTGSCTSREQSEVGPYAPVKRVGCVELVRKEQEKLTDPTPPPFPSLSSGFSGELDSACLTPGCIP